MPLHYYNLNCPIKSKTISPVNDSKPWIDQSMENQIKTCQNYYLSWILGKMSKSGYKRFRNSVKNSILWTFPTPLPPPVLLPFL